MAAILNTLTGRIILIGLLIHAVLLPLLFYGLLYIVEQSHEDSFVNDVRKYSRFVADAFELDETLKDELTITRQLDSALLGSGGVYAEVYFGSRRIQSSLMSDNPPIRYAEDFKFGDHDDNIYFLSIPFHVPDDQAVLRMGFDELPIHEQIKNARQRLVTVLLSYLLVSIIILVYLSTRMIRPLRKLQDASRNIVHGNYDHQLHVNSKITEVAELSQDLESMRVELVGINESLIQQIAEKEAADEHRQELEKKLRQTQKMETVGVMAGGIAHEFNNILVPIFLYTEQAIHTLPEESPVHKLLERVLKASRRAKNMVQQILTFSRQPADQEVNKVDMKDVVEEALELLRALIPATVSLSYEIPDEDCHIMADKTQIHQLVMNLCSNAYQALDHSGGAITVLLDRTEIGSVSSANHNLPPGQYVRLKVKDTGHGIDRSNLSRVFEPFYTTRAVGKGTGLGLSVVHGIAVSHHGDITVNSEPGKGAEFTVYLPVVNDSDIADQNIAI